MRFSFYFLIFIIKSHGQPFEPLNFQYDSFDKSKIWISSSLPRIKRIEYKILNGGKSQQWSELKFSDITVGVRWIRPGSFCDRIQLKTILDNELEIVQDLRNEMVEFQPNFAPKLVNLNYDAQSNLIQAKIFYEKRIRNLPFTFGPSIFAKPLLKMDLCSKIFRHIPPPPFIDPQDQSTVIFSPQYALSNCSFSFGLEIRVIMEREKCIATLTTRKSEDLRIELSCLTVRSISCGEVTIQQSHCLAYCDPVEFDASISYSNKKYLIEWKFPYYIAQNTKLYKIRCTEANFTDWNTVIRQNNSFDAETNAPNVAVSTMGYANFYMQICAVLGKCNAIDWRNVAKFKLESFNIKHRMAKAQLKTPLALKDNGSSMTTFKSFLCLSITIYLHIDYANCGCLSRKLCCKNRNASCSATEIIAMYGAKNVASTLSPTVTVAETSITNVVVDTTTKTLNVFTIANHKNLSENVQRYQNLFFDLSLIKNRSEMVDDYRMEPVGYEDLDYGSGFEPGSANDDLNYTINNPMSTDQISIDVENDSRYKFIEVFSPADRNHKRRHVTDMQTFYNGGAKEISYLIVGEKTTESMTMQADQSQIFPTVDANVILEKHCYCDEDCLFLHDCCADYTEACPAIDCAVSAWSEWSECSGHSTDPICGPGISFRERRVNKDSENGGVQCPILKEEKACYNANPSLECGVKASELALLLPYAYNEARKPIYKTNMYYDITLEPYVKPSDPSLSYCSIFQITWQSANCTEDKHLTGISQNFRVGEQICVQCEPTASKSAKDHIHYYSISYNKRQTLTEEESAGYLGERLGDEISNQKPRCTGDGAEDVETWFSLINRWVDSTNSYKNNCFGRWKLIEQEKTCKCDKNYANLEKFIFV
uniref:SMB domain-containing protein n=1 Tax=Romanomermis culicivorax TaxID=13658 RepID=A0A915K2F6_ROMCU